MSRSALIVWGGWDGHQPHEIADRCAAWLTEDGFEVDISNSLDSFLDLERLKRYSLIVPCWTMGKISDDQLKNVRAAIESGVGLAGSHGGMCDAFREATDWHWITGGQWVAHPGNAVPYTVRIIRGSHPIVEGIADFSVTTEQYYMHTDPSNRVLATTEFPTVDGPHAANGKFDMPVIWTRYFGKGRVFYNSVGHDLAVFTADPMPMIMRRGYAWAAR